MKETRNDMEPGAQVAWLGPMTIQLPEEVLQRANDAVYGAGEGEQEVEFCTNEARRLFTGSNVNEDIATDFMKWIATLRWHVYDLFKNRGVANAKFIIGASGPYGRTMPAIEFQLRDIGTVRFAACHMVGRADERPCFVPVRRDVDLAFSEFMRNLSISC